MIAADVFVITGALALLCLARWRVGVVVTLLFGFGLDTMRKLLPGEPLYVHGLVFVLVAATLLGARARGVPLSPRPIFARGSILRTPLILFLLLVAIQSVAGFARTGSPMIALIGLIAYLAPFPGVVLGYAYVRGTRDVRTLMRWYVACVAVMTAGIYLARVGFDWHVLDAVGAGLVAYSPTGQPLDLASGFFRAPEVAAWHTAMASCFLLVLFLSRRKVVAQLWPAAVIGLYLLVALVFTGRRKGLVEIALFVLVYLFFLVRFRRKAFRAVLVLGVLGATVLALVTLSDLGDSLGIAPYTARGATLGMEDADRYWRFTTGALWLTIQHNGWLGAGAGMGSQGAQYFDGGLSLVGGAAEGGLGKVAAELGVPGLVLLPALTIAIGLYLWKIARQASRGGAAASRRAHYAYGLIAFLFANAAMFAVAHQIYGDPLVLYVIGLVLGMAFAIPRLRVERRPRRRKLPPTPEAAAVVP